MTRTLAFLVSSVLVASGCGGSSDEDARDEGAATTGTEEVGATGDDGAAATGGSGTGTLSLDDGTEYTFAMSSCATAATEPETFLVDPGYDLFGESEDGFRLTLLRAGLDEDSAIASGDLEGEFDADGVNPEISYATAGDEDVMLELDGSSVTGTVAMTSSGPSPPLGESIEATIDITC